MSHSKAAGKNISILRESKKLSQSELANLSCVSQSTIAQIETGKKYPSVATINKIANGLRVHPARLISDDTICVIEISRLGRIKCVGDLTDSEYRLLSEINKTIKRIEL